MSRPYLCSPTLARQMCRPCWLCTRHEPVLVAPYTTLDRYTHAHTLHSTPTALHCAALPTVLVYSCWQPMLFAGAPSGNVCYGGHRSSVQHAVPVCTLPARGMYDDAAAAAVALHVELVNGQREREGESGSDSSMAHTSLCHTRTCSSCLTLTVTVESSSKSMFE